MRVSLLLAGLLATVPAGATKPTSRVCNVADYGARADGRSRATQAIQRAIDSCAAGGGGVVLLSRGTFLSGTLVLKDNVTLRIAPHATLRASPEISDFTAHPPEDVPLIAVEGSTQSKGNGPFHLIDASDAHHISIDGGGTIDGNGSAYWDRDPQKGLVSKRPRPSPLIEFVDSSDIRVEHLKIRIRSNRAMSGLPT
jgi:polygalacturonase